ncbi:CAP domain-containing protein [Sediminibacterium sp.]|uniref:CAP domain-containing protein n=1 Tax=Sediminibacterium sp. TaxID=1917865 RepID=UPI003F6ED2F8
MKPWALFFLLVSCSWVNAQNYSQVVLTDIPFEPKLAVKQVILEKLTQNKTYRGSDPLSQSFIYWTNYARLYPNEFRDSALLPYLNQQPRLRGKYANSLIEALSKVDPLPFLAPEEKLSLAAQNHAKDIKSNGGSVSHQGSDGSGFGDRMRKVGYKGCAAENISLGKDKLGLSSLLLLYLDINLPDLGHRKNLLNPNYKKMGVSSVQLNDNQTLIVQELGCEEAPKN